MENETGATSCLKPGFAFRLDKRKGGYMVLPNAGAILYPARNEGYPETEILDYGVIMPGTRLDQETRDICIFHGPWLKEDYNPHWVTRGQIPGNSPLVQGLPDEEFASVKDRLEHWVHKTQAFGFFDYKELEPGEKLELTNRL